LVDAQGTDALSLAASLVEQRDLAGFQFQDLDLPEVGVAVPLAVMK
jgi:hypothetical protein